MDGQAPKIGTGVVVLDNDFRLLFGRRIYNPVGWSLPGGHLEYGETLEDCAKRETIEEVGIEIEKAMVMTVGENIFPEKNLHSITIFVFARIKEGQEPKNMEPNKCGGWEWFDIKDIPSDLSFNYKPILDNWDKLINAYKEAIF